MTALSFNLSKFQKFNRFQINPTKLFNYERSTQGCDSCTVTIQPERHKLKDSDRQKNVVGWWIEIFTAHPACIYYFGAFEHPHHAEAALPEFINDLLDEGAKGLVSRIDYHSPIDLTVDLDHRENLLSQRTNFPPGVYLL